MEVNRIGKADAAKGASKPSEVTASTSFTEIMGQKRDAAQIERFNQRLVDIENQGKKLAEHRTVEDLNKFKKLVKDLMDDAVKFGLKLEEKQGFTRRGKSKIYKIIKEVDKKLLDITDATLDKQKSNLDILAMVGGIKGLIVNIYT